ncbi:MAG TPA: ABC transporter permease [Bryobacteraceae bacterium]|jgi:spermidine/putrescine transport system permease protein|nr:ABC transporter permease [Bryobacteraceae bacterium]
MNLRARFLLPGRVWMALFFAAPLAIVCGYSFLTRGDYGGVEQPWTVENFTRLADPIYLGILWRSLWMALLATALCALLGFPLALFIARAGQRKNLWLQLVLLPFWTSFLVRTYAWLFILRDTGLVNTVLMRLHVISSPLPLLYNGGAVLLGLVYNFLPFFVLPMYATLERLDPALMEASADLGARPMTTLCRVIVPVSAPGIVAGSVLVFIPCLGAYLTPDLLGGGKTVMLGNLVQNQFTTARDWPFGSAASLALMLASALLLAALMRSRFAKELM